MIDENHEHQLKLFETLLTGEVEPLELAEIILIIHRRLGRLEAQIKKLDEKIDNQIIATEAGFKATEARINQQFYNDTNTRI
jgi:hypothetical protein